MKNTHTYLQSLSQSNYQIKDDEPDITGWEVRSETGAYIGRTTDLLFDPQSNAVRYLVVDLTENGMHLDGKSILIPIGIAELHSENDEVTLPNLHLDQFNAMPAYHPETIDAEMEEQVREVIGSPAALRLESQIVEQDLKNFYAHTHFERDNFYNRNRSAEQKTIHELVENAKARNQDEFTPGHHEKKPWLEPGASHNQGG
jgi:hypothetical protein